jgi:hypothetical protein
MSENEVEETLTSTEDKFFGVKTQHGQAAENSPSEEEGATELEVEVIDDTPAEEKKPQKRSRELAEPDVKYDDGFTDDELKGYSKNVQKRINQLRAVNHSDKRKVGEAQRMRDEAVKLAKAQQQKLKEYESLLAKGQSAIIQQTKGKAEVELQTAKKELKKAHEEGDADALVESQSQLSAAQARIREMETREQQLKRTLTQQQAAAKQQQAAAQQRAQQPPSQPQPQVELSSEQRQWNEKNPWFQPQGKPGQPVEPLHKEMTAVGLAIHDNLFHEGVTAHSDPQRYYSEVDRRMRERFPDYSGFQDGREERSTPSRQRSNTTVVAPSTNRNNGAKTRKVSLTKTQEALAKRLGITNEQYAEQMLRQEVG